jgi:hypothetical protein
MKTEIHRGSCLCGETVYEVRGPLRDSIACHCTQCRKQTGHYLSATSAALADFNLVRGDHVRWYRSSDTARRAFCSNCGSTLFWQADARPDQISIATGTLDGPTGIVTEGHIFCADKGDYYVIPPEGYQRAGWQ